MITVRYARNAPPEKQRPGGRSSAGAAESSPKGAPAVAAAVSQQEVQEPILGVDADPMRRGQANSATSSDSGSQQGGAGGTGWRKVDPDAEGISAGVIRPQLDIAQWQALDSYAPAAVDALLAVAAGSGDAVMLDSARAAGLVGESLEESESGTAVPRRIRAVWRQLRDNPQHKVIAEEWLGRALVESPGAVVKLLLDIKAPDWTPLAQAVLAAGVDPWMPLPGDETRIAWGQVPGVALESPSIVALALERGLEFDDQPNGPSALRALAPRRRAGVPMVGLLHDPQRPDEHGRPVDLFEAVAARYERTPLPEAEVAFALSLADASATPEQDDLLAEASAQITAQLPAPVESAMGRFGSDSADRSGIVGEAGLRAGGRSSAGEPSPLAGLDPITARIARRAGALLTGCFSDPSKFVGVAPLSALDRPETVESLSRQRWLFITRLAALAGPAARLELPLSSHERDRLIPWPLVIVIAAGAPARATRAEAQADDRRAAAALRAIAGPGLMIDASDSMGRSALLLACRRPDRAETVRTLLELGAHPNHVDGRGRDASTYARHGGNVQVIAAMRNAQARTVLERLRGPDLE